MPSAEHESPVALAKLDPELVAWALTNLFKVSFPDYHHTRDRATEVRVMVPRTYHADSMVLFCDQADRPLLAVVLEVQRSRDPDKQRTWKLYLAQLEVELGVDAALLVYCPDPGVARWYERLVGSEGLSLPLRPFIFTPGDIPMVKEVELAQANPPLAILSAICHGGDAEVDHLFPPLAEALRSVDPQRAVSYYDIVLAALPPAARVRWEEFMTTVAEEYRSELFREIAARNRKLGEAEGEARGEARGEGRAVLRVLEARGVPVPDAVREQILACTDLAQLDSWLRRAVTATTAEEVVR